MVFVKEFFQKNNFEKNQQTTKKHEKLPVNFQTQDNHKIRTNRRYNHYRVMYPTDSDGIENSEALDQTALKEAICIKSDPGQNPSKLHQPVCNQNSLLQLSRRGGFKNH